MKRKSQSPSTKARRAGYAVMRGLGKLLYKLIDKVVTDDSTGMSGQFISLELSQLGWKDFMVRHMPKDKLGGPEQTAKRKKQKRKDRKNTIR